MFRKLFRVCFRKLCRRKTVFLVINCSEVTKEGGAIGVAAPGGIFWVRGGGGSFGHECPKNVDRCSTV